MASVHSVADVLIPEDAEDVRILQQWRRKFAKPNFSLARSDKYRPYAQVQLLRVYQYESKFNLKLLIFYCDEKFPACWIFDVVQSRGHAKNSKFMEKALLFHF